MPRSEPHRFAQGLDRLTRFALAPPSERALAELRRAPLTLVFAPFVRGKHAAQIGRNSPFP